MARWRRESLHEKLARQAGLILERGLEDYVLEAERLDGDVWEVQISPL